MIVIDIRNSNIVIGVYVTSKLSYVFDFKNKIKKISYTDHIEMKYYYEPYLTLQGLYLIGLKKNA